jgi:hypothetical protein
MRDIRSWILALIATATLIVSVIAYPVTRFILKLDSTNEQLSFSVEGWNSPMTRPDGVFAGTRLKMVDDLLKRYDFHGWSTIEVQQLLGKPIGRRPEEQKNLVMYDLRDGLNLLIFEVDSQQRVVDYYVRRED